MILLSQIDRFGIEAVLGRKTFYAGEMRQMITAENIYLGYQQREQETNWAEWARKNKAISELLIEAEKLCQS